MVTVKLGDKRLTVDSDRHLLYYDKTLIPMSEAEMNKAHREGLDMILVSIEL